MRPSIPVPIPCENVNDLTAKVLVWKFSAGTRVKKGDLIVELENSKTTFHLEAPAEGVLDYARAEGDEVPVGETLFHIHPDGLPAKTAPAPTPTATPPPAKAAAASPAPAAANPPATGPIFSKKAKELLGELGLDPSMFAGMAMVRESDVLKKAGERAPAAAAPSAPTPKIAPTQPDLAGEMIPLERAKLIENRELLSVERSVLRTTLFYQCPAAGFSETCARPVPPVPRLAVVLYETAQLLKQHRHLNACYRDDAIFAYDHVNLGFAVDLGRGLKVLVLRRAQELSFAELSSRFDDLLVKYATNTLGVTEVSGSTFTVTDLAQEGVHAFSPLINSQQAAILAVGAESQGPAGISNGFLLGCSFDHRLTGGRQVAAFLRELSGRIEAHADSLRQSDSAGDSRHCARCFQSTAELRVIRAFLLPSMEPPGYICSNCLAGD